MDQQYERLVLEAHLTIQGQRHLAGVLEAVADAGRRLGVPCSVGCLMPDGALEAWRLTALFDPRTRPVNLLALDVPLGPIAFTPPARVTIAGLTELLGSAWGSEACQRVERMLGSATAVCVPVPGDHAPRAVLLALPVATEQVSLLAATLVHAATAVPCHLPAERVEPAGTNVLNADMLNERAAQELDRAQRYARPLAVVAVDLAGDAPEPAAAGAVVLQRLRRYDLVGRVDAGRPLLAVVLPETDRRGAEGSFAGLQADCRGCGRVRRCSPAMAAACPAWCWQRAIRPAEEAGPPVTRSAARYGCGLMRLGAEEQAAASA